MSTCPCGSGATYAVCCEPIISGAQPAATAEQLMRARYSAYVGVEMDFVFESTHPDHRQGYDHAGTKNGPRVPNGWGLRSSGHNKVARGIPSARWNSSPVSARRASCANTTRMPTSREMMGAGHSARER